MRTLVRNGRLALDGRVEPGSVLVEDGRILAVGAVEGPADLVLDASGAWVLPGLVDFHAHLADRIGRFDLADDYESGTRAAVENGVTTVCAFATQAPGALLGDAVRAARAKARGRCHAHVAWHLTPTRFSREDAEDLERLVAAGHRTVKLYTTYREAGLHADAARIEDLFRRLAPRGVRFLLHCEDDDLLAGVETARLDVSRPLAHARLRPEAAEVAAIDAALALAARCGAPLHVVHVSTVRGAERLREARGRQDATCETCPQYLWLDEAWLDRPDGHRWVCSPPLRRDRERFRALARDGAFDVIATDHCAFTRRDKDDRDPGDVRTVACGLPGLGALAHLAWRLWADDPDRAAAEVALRLSRNPAERLGLGGRRGALRAGYDADLVVLDPAGPVRPLRSTHADAWEAYPGFESALVARHVLLGGERVVADGRLVAPDRPLGRIHPPSD